MCWDIWLCAVEKLGLNRWSVGVVIRIPRVCGSDEAIRILVMKSKRRDLKLYS